MTDWTRVERAVYRVRQHYRYTYTGPVWDLRQRLVMIPRDVSRDQRTLNYELDVRGTEGDHLVFWERDAFGNRVAKVIANRVPLAVDFEATFRVERVRQDGPQLEPTPWEGRGWEIYLEHTALTAPDLQLERAARGIADESRDRRVRAELAHEWASHAIRYQYGVTGYTTPAAMALHLGKGVCQDYTHLALAILRALGLPARYVSGYLYPITGSTTSSVGTTTIGESHAWVEFWAGDWVAADPTGLVAVAERHIVVARGRDYADVRPLSGVYHGPPAESLGVKVELTRLR